MKRLKASAMAAIAATLQLAGIQSSNAQTSANLFPASYRAVCISTNASGNLVYKSFGTGDLIRQCLAETGVTNATRVALVYNMADNALQVVSGTNKTVLCTPLSFSGGLSLTNTNNTRVELESFVFVEKNTVASGLLSATESLKLGTNGQLASFRLFGQLNYSAPADGTNPPAIYRGFLSVGSLFFYSRDHADDGGASNSVGITGDPISQPSTGQD